MVAPGGRGLCSTPVVRVYARASGAAGPAEGGWPGVFDDLSPGELKAAQERKPQGKPDWSRSALPCQDPERGALWPCLRLCRLLAVSPWKSYLTFSVPQYLSLSPGDCNSPDLITGL